MRREVLYDTYDTWKMAKNNRKELSLNVNHNTDARFTTLSEFTAA